MKTLAMLSGVLLLAACQKAETPPAENAGADTSVPVQAGNTAGSANGAAVAATDAAPPAFAQCKVCHVTEAGAPNGVGPNLHGVYGTKAAAIAGYDFSPAMKASGLTWDDATLDRYLAKPMEVVPGTKMAFAGLPDANKRQQVMAYLKTLK